MLKPQFERDACYLAALAIFKSLRQKGLLTESELVKAAAILAEKFSPSPFAMHPDLACIK